MKHYFHFKKGQSVPQWLLRVLDADTMEPINTAAFKSNGKVMVDDETGKAIIWPASKRFSCVVKVDGQGKSLFVDAWGFNNTMFGFDAKPLSPLSLARKHGMDPYTTTKCLPLPANFERFSGGK